MNRRDFFKSAAAFAAVAGFVGMRSSRASVRALPSP